MGFVLAGLNPMRLMQAPDQLIFPKLLKRISRQKACATAGGVFMLGLLRAQSSYDIPAPFFCSDRCAYFTAWP